MKRLLVCVLLFACGRPETPVVAPRPSILLITLDTTRADAIGAATPSINALAARGRRYNYAYATTPQTLPSHSSMMTGLYPAGHGVHENGRFLDGRHSTLAERMKSAGYSTAAFVSAFAVAKRFGIARGFEVYDENFGAGRAERDAKATTEQALAWLASAPAQPLFVWVHYYDPHYPYTPPEPHRTRYAQQPYLGEVAFMDEQLGRLASAFEKRGPATILVVADHGEGLGDHGEAQHGNLLYQSTMHVPMILTGAGVTAGSVDTPISTRHVSNLLLQAAGLAGLPADEDVVMAEAMKPFLDYGWQPQVMAVDGKIKAIRAGRVEVYDVVSDPRESTDVAAKTDLSRGIRRAFKDYPLPSTKAETEQLDEEERRKLASLGYIASSVAPVVRPDAPRPADMTELYPILDEAAALFVAERYAESIPLLERILAADRTNLDAALRLATAHSSLGHDEAALRAFQKAEAIAPDNADVRTYLALHLARGSEWPRAVPMLERILADTPNKVPALEALALVRERQGRLEGAIALRKKLYELRAPSGAELIALGQLAMQTGNTAVALEAFTQARTAQGREFRNDLELGVLLLAAGRYAEARDALDRIPSSHPAYPMALFKRAQVSVLLREPDARQRIDAARAGADPTTRELIARERLFQQ